MFRGTHDYPPDKYQAILTAAGARQNAYTTDDFTNYHTTFAKEDLETMLEIEADRFQNLSYSAEASRPSRARCSASTTRTARTRSASSIEVQRDNAFTTHTYKHTTMGFLKDIEDMPNQFEYSKTFFDRWYRPGVHDDHRRRRRRRRRQVIPLVEKYWGDWKRGQLHGGDPAGAGAEGAGLRARALGRAPTLPWVTVAFHGPAFSETEKDFAAIDMLST